MLAWVMNLGFAAGGHAPQPPVLGTSTGGGGHRRGSIWEPRVDLIIAEAKARREVITLKAQEVELRKQLEPRRKSKKRRAFALSAAQRQRIEEALARLGAFRQEKETKLEEIQQELFTPEPPPLPPPVRVVPAPAPYRPRAALAPPVEDVAAKLLIRRRDEEAIAAVIWLALFAD